MTEIETITAVAVVIAVGVPVGVFHRAVARELRALHDRVFWNDVPKKPADVVLEPSAPTLRSEADVPAPPLEPDPIPVLEFPIAPKPMALPEKRPMKREHARKKGAGKKRGRTRASAR